MADSSPIVSTIAGRYAAALFELAKEAGAIEGVEADLRAFAAMLNSSADLDRLVRSPAFSAEEQVAAIAELLKKAGISGLAANFLQLIAAKRRLFAVRGMIAAFEALVAQHQGIVSAEVTIAKPLSEKHRAALVATLAERAGKRIALTERVDPSILGGLVVKMGSRMVDASLKTRLNAMKLAMKHV